MPRGWVARIGHRLVGVIRARESDGLLLIGRIAIAPDVQGLGIGQALLEAAEMHSDAAGGGAVHREPERGQHPAVRALRLPHRRAGRRSGRHRAGLPAQAVERTPQRPEEITTTDQRIRIGTSGWSYDHWEAVLYPPGLAARDRLARYVAEFDTVELNASFYRWPPASPLPQLAAAAAAGLRDVGQGAARAHPRQALYATRGVDRRA